MAGKFSASQPTSSFDFELVGDYSDQLTTVVASSYRISLWIDPSTIRLRHRIGRGPFGDVWLATRHQVTEDYEEYHEVAVKMLHPMQEDTVNIVLCRLNDLFSKCHELESICRMEGVSMISGKLCIVMKFYEDSIGDKMSHLKGRKLSLLDVIRYGTDLVQGITELHSKEIPILNLKPFNFLLNEADHAILVDIGIPYALLGIPLPSLEMTQRFDTPNYMATEQWQPEVRGPISFETDSWGFASASWRC